MDVIRGKNVFPVGFEHHAAWAGVEILLQEFDVLLQEFDILL